MEPKKLGPFTLGVNNRLQDQELSRVKGAFLRSAVNVDMTAHGTIKRRLGSEKVVAGSDCHSLWSGADQSFFVDGTVLYSLSGERDAPTKTQVRTGIAPGARLSYTNANGEVIFTDGSVLRRVVGGVDKALSLPTINPEPVVTAGGVGSLAAGLYQVCLAYHDVQLAQSAATIIQQVEVVAGQGIIISGLPAAFPTGITGILVFMSPVNGDQLFLARALIAPQASLTIATMPQLQGRSQTALLAPMPAGEIVRYGSGRLLVAVGRFLFYSDPYALGLYRPSRNFIPFADPITVVECTPDHTYIATEKLTYRFTGDIATAKADEVLPYGGVARTGGMTPDSERAFWMSDRGVVVTAADGSLNNVQEKNLALNAAVSGASYYRERDGMKQIVAAGFGVEQTGAAAYSYMSGEIVRKAATPL